MHTVGRLARRFGLSRSTLLYYDRIGLLSPLGRTAAGYRIYSDDEVARLEKILVYRGVGVPLETIGELIASEPGSVGDALEERLRRINVEIADLRKQQKLILRLLTDGDGDAARRTRVMDKQGWTALLHATGLDDADMGRWHREFEHLAPEAHQDFLESLGIESDEIRTIRKRSRLEEPAEK